MRGQAAQLAADTCRWLELLAELIVRDVWAVPGARTPAQWLSWTIGVAGSTAREHVRLALQLRELPMIRERFGQDRISYSKVRAVTQVAVPEIQEMLLTWADAATAADLERVVRGFRSAQRTRQAAGTDSVATRAVARRSERDGTVTIMIRALPDEPASIDSMVERLVELERSAEPGRDREGGDDGRTLGDERVDGSIHALSTAVDAGPVDTSGLDRHTLVLHLDGDALVGEADEAAEVPVHIQDGDGHVRGMDRRVVRRLACTAGLVPTLRTRTASPWTSAVASAACRLYCAARSSRTTDPVGSRDVVQPGTCMHTASATGPMADQRTRETSCSCVASTIGSCTSGVGASTRDPRGSISSHPRAPTRCRDRGSHRIRAWAPQTSAWPVRN